jgi:CRP/FNR family transcriptional regulator, cyclic AMP receptor protein
MDIDNAFAKIAAGLPLASYRAGETVLAAGTKSGRLLVLKNGGVAVLKDRIEVARVQQPGAVIGELSALLDVPHTADIRALEASQFYVADAALLTKEPIALLHVARILAGRIIEANNNFVELRQQVESGSSPNSLGRILKKIEGILSVGGASFET